MKFEFEGKIAVVTGAGKGIGKETAIQLAKAGAKVALMGPRIESLSETKAAIERFSPDVITVLADVSDEAQVMKGAKEILSKWNRVDVLINNAGIDIMVEHAPDEFKTLGVFEATSDQYEKLIRTNTMGHYFTVKAFGPKMLENKYGRIVNVSSVVGLNGGFGTVPYISSKGASIAQTKILADQLGPYVHVNCVAPGMVNTPMHKNTPKQMFEMVAKGCPLKKVAEPIDIAIPILFLASEDCFMTGQVLVVDGGNYK